MFAYYKHVEDLLGPKIPWPSVDPGGLPIDPSKPDDPFWILLAGKDFENGGISRADTIILAYIDPGHKRTALVSIPRDAYVSIPGFWTDKINAAYAYGSLPDNDYTGPTLLGETVRGLTGIQAAAYAEIDIDGVWAVVEALGGVLVNVPVDIIDDPDSGPGNIYAGEQVLDGSQALKFLRSRQVFYALGDYQRQANQRTFLQALARQVLSADVVTIGITIGKICEMLSTSLDLTDIIRIAKSMHGMVESDIYTYSIPCVSEMINGIWYEIPDVETTRALFATINSGVFPDPYEWGLTKQGEIPNEYMPKPPVLITDPSHPDYVPVIPSEYTIDVRNGCGIAGSATATSEFITSFGYIRGGVGDASEYTYTETLIVYRGNSYLAAATDIQARLGYGKLVPSQGRYNFENDILVVVGADYRPPS